MYTTNMKLRVITVNDNMQHDCTYECSEPMGENFAEDFTPELTPKQMLAMGVFEGNYFQGYHDEFPKDWFAEAKLSETKDASLNCFNIAASQPLEVWQQKGWIHPVDPKGWFQWYCRYYMGRRFPEEDTRQIKRWRAIVRHAGAIRKNCMRGDVHCRPKQRQALLHWAYDSTKI